MITFILVTYLAISCALSAYLYFQDQKLLAKQEILLKKLKKWIDTNEKA